MFDKEEYWKRRREEARLRSLVNETDKKTGQLTKAALEARMKLVDLKHAGKIKSYTPQEWNNLTTVKRVEFGGGPRQVRRRMELDQRRLSE